MEFIHYEIKKKFVIGIKANRLIALSEEGEKKSVPKSKYITTQGWREKHSQVKRHLFSCSFNQEDLQKQRRLYTHSIPRYKWLRK